MTTELIVHFGYKATVLVLALSLPPILVATGVGLLVSIFQALTQIQEQTLSFGIKLVAVIATLMVIMPWAGAEIVQFTVKMLSEFPVLTR